MRIAIPDFTEKKDLFDYLVSNKKALIKQKKSMPIHGDGIKAAPSFIGAASIGSGFKAGLLAQGETLPEGVLRAKIVANAANFVDSHMDLLIPDAPKKSIKERKGLIPQLHDHIHQTTAEIGDVKDILLLDVPIRELGYDKDGSTQAVVFIVDIKAAYNQKAYDRYKDGRATQHSIGLQYIKMELAINHPDYEKELDFFNKYYDQIIDKEVVDERGYFWVVQEYALIENSMVLFGSNPYTPTLEIAENEKSEPSKDTRKAEPSKDTRRKSKRIEAWNDVIGELNKTLN